MSLIHVIVLAIVQGLAELLPISSSAHVVVVEKLMGLDPSAPALTLLLVLLHTGTMFAVIAYFWRQWRLTYFASRDAFMRFATHVVIATALTGIVGYGLGKLVVRVGFKTGDNRSGGAAVLNVRVCLFDERGQGRTSSPTGRVRRFRRCGEGKAARSQPATSRSVSRPAAVAAERRVAA